MIASFVAAALAFQNPAALPQGPVDAPVFVDSISGIAIGRPFPDWVFEPDRSRRATRVIIFHPASGSLGDMLWGALAITTFRRQVPLGQLAEQRVSDTWQPTLGASFQLLTRDSLTLLGYPAVHLVMSGAINQAALDVEEYLIARGTEFVALQFRYPRAVPRDSVASGYRHALEALRLGGPDDAAAEVPPADEDRPVEPPAEAPPAAPAPAPAAAAPDTAVDFVPPAWRQMWAQLADSPWRVDRVDAAIRLDDPAAAPTFVVRMDVVNDGLAPAEYLPLWFPLGATVDSLQLGRAGARTYTGAALSDGAAFQLPDTVSFQGRFTLTAYYRRGPLAGPAASFTEDWLPAVESSWDSAGRGRAVALPQRVTLRFDVPEGLAAVATGHLTADVRGSGRRLETWVAEGVTAAVPGFAIGPFLAASGTAGRLAVNVWDTPADSEARDSCAHLVADAWSFDARAFGVATAPEVNVVVGSPVSRGLPGLLLLATGAATDPGVVRREMARTWWGGAVRGAGPGSAWIDEAFPAFAARAAADTSRDRGPVWRSASTAPLATIVPDSSSDIRVLRTAGAAALEALRQAIGDGALREALKSFAINHRGGFASADDFLSILPNAGAAALRPYLYGN